MPSRPLRVAICGAGIAGPTLAYWLLRAGHRPTLIEQAPEFRTGGYMIDFWGAGYTIAERMGLMPAIRGLGYEVREVRLVDDRGRRVGGFSADVFRRSLNERFTSLPRGDLARALYDASERRVETIFGDSVVALKDTGSAVEVVLLRAGRREFDLVVGADGIHSDIRALAFDHDAVEPRPLPFHVAAFEAQGYRPRDELVYLSHAVAGRQIARFALRGDRTMFLFVFAAERLAGAEPRDTPTRKAALARVFGDVGWEGPEILGRLLSASDLYFDRVSQIQMPRWSRGRVALIGDAASSVSLLAGEGAGLAMLQAYVLAGELARSAGDHRAAFGAYARRLQPFLLQKQRSARRFAPAFAPRTTLGLWTRNLVTRLMQIQPLADRIIGADLRDDIGVPDYDFTAD